MLEEPGSDTHVIFTVDTPAPHVEDARRLHFLDPGSGARLEPVLAQAHRSRSRTTSAHAL